MAVPMRLDSGRNAVEAGTPVPLFAARLSGYPQAATYRQYMVSPVESHCNSTSAKLQY